MTSVLKSWEQYQSALAKSISDPEGFWANEAESFTWKEKWSKVLDWNFDEPRVEWFSDAKLNKQNFT